jgi:squalene cyclase
VSEEYLNEKRTKRKGVVKGKEKERKGEGRSSKREGVFKCKGNKKERSSKREGVVKGKE